MTILPRKRHTLAQGVVEQISNSIAQGVLKPGDKLPTESAIMELHGVSRTVVREAISHLQASGMVQTRHGIGTFVLERPKQGGLGFDAQSIVTVRDVLAILELRISMETETAGLAAVRRNEEQVAELASALGEMRAAMEQGKGSVEADRRFHLTIARATGNRYFVDILGQLGQAIIPRARLDTAGMAERPADYLQRVQREHEDIFRAIQRQDPEAARAAMRTHLSNSRERLLYAQQQMENAA